MGRKDFVLETSGMKEMNERTKEETTRAEFLKLYIHAHKYPPLFSTAQVDYKQHDRIVKKVITRSFRYILYDGTTRSSLQIYASDPNSSRLHVEFSRQMEDVRTYFRHRVTFTNP